jgi:REP element-mobilizing transposase RayT
MIGTKMSYDNLNRGRCSIPHQAYCITTVTRERQPLFLDFTIARLLIRELRRLHEAGDVNSLAWVIMPDHLHWLLQLTTGASLAQVVKLLKGRSSRVITVYVNGEGGIWQRAYYDRAVRSDDDIRQSARYIVANPLRAGRVAEIANYPHWDCAWL